jgi:ProP effector
MEDGMTIPKEDVHATLRRLAEWFPQTFVAEKHLPHRPLKVGIDRDVLARCPDLDRRERSTVLRYYTSRVMYLQSLVAGAVRVDLDGNPAGEVSATDAEQAAARLAEILASRQAKRAAALAVDRAARISSPTAAPAASPPPLAVPPPAAAPPPAAKVSVLKGKPVLRLPAFRQQGR